ncbi:uncharacterized protein LOC119983017 [Tripterygium wilfordii]|uniref:uncharacterized protein LOC119983017 n=1 Tax=Tripterygium wilfordii TaxID=458696 RepID=UPI0018F84B62|nr:uncharacterized protein LOC119983017 [Tripterygium wilfordii]
MEESHEGIPKQQRNEEEPLKQEPKADPPPQSPPQANSNKGWGGWGISAFSVLTDLQKAATAAAEEISRNAAVAAEKAAKSIADMQISAEDSESSKEEKEAGDNEEGEAGESAAEKETDDEDDNARKSVLDKLEKASEDSILGQRLKVLDDSVENFASGAWQALGNAWKGGTNLVQKLEHSAVNLAESIQHGNLPGAAPSLIETGKAFTSKGMQVLEYVGKETMDLLITETGIEVEKVYNDPEHHTDEDRLLEDVTFDRCFYIYGGPEQLEELEALSSHYALLFNRRKAKLSSEQKSIYDGKLKLVQQIFMLSNKIDGNVLESDKGKKIETGSEGNGNEMKSLHDSSVNKAADMAVGFTSTLAELKANDIIQRTAGRLESLHSEGVHRVSEMCCFAVSQLLMVGKSIISFANGIEEEDADMDMMNIDWPADSVEKARIIRTKAQMMTGYVEEVSSSFITGISDVAEAYLAAIKATSVDSQEVVPQKSIQEKANVYSENLTADKNIAVAKIQDGLQYLSYVVLSTSMPTA